jgi:hypothetical protein
MLFLTHRQIELSEPTEPPHAHFTKRKTAEAAFNERVTCRPILSGDERLPNQSANTANITKTLEIKELLEFRSFSALRRRRRVSRANGAPGPGGGGDPRVRDAVVCSDALYKMAVFSE